MLEYLVYQSIVFARMVLFVSHCRADVTRHVSVAKKALHRSVEMARQTLLGRSEFLLFKTKHVRES